MTPTDIAVQRLLQAHRTHQTQPAPPLTDTPAAYGVQERVARELGWFGADTPRHWKSGGASRTAALVHAPLPPVGVVPGPARLPEGSFKPLGIEAEVALRLCEPVDHQRAAMLDHHSARALIDTMAVSIEWVASRWTEGTMAPALAQLADSLSHGGLVLGSWVAFDPTFDWTTQVCRVRIGMQPERAFQGRHSLGDPAYVLPAWLRHATRHGATQDAGGVVTTGSWCGLVTAQPGEDVTVTFDGIGQVRLHW